MAACLNPRSIESWCIAISEHKAEIWKDRGWIYLHFNEIFILASEPWDSIMKSRHKKFYTYRFLLITWPWTNFFFPTPVLLFFPRLLPYQYFVVRSWWLNALWHRRNPVWFYFNSTFHIQMHFMAEFTPCLLQLKWTLERLRLLASSKQPYSYSLKKKGCLRPNQSKERSIYASFPVLWLVGEVSQLWVTNWVSGDKHGVIPNTELTWNFLPYC